LIRDRILAVVTAVAVAAVAGCGDEGSDPDEVRAAFVAAVDAAAVGDVDGPNVTTSKDVSYLTGSGVVDGDPESAAEQVASGLRDDGWDVSEPAPAGGGNGMTVVANDGNVVIQISLYTKVGVNTAPQGAVLAQIRAAPADAGLAWTS
jgi:hypothetical protein